MAIYTKKGDKGETSLYSPKDPRGQRISKKDKKIEAIGAIDELNSFLGITSSLSEDKNLKNRIEEIQSDLLTIGSILAGSSLSFSKPKTTKLEKEIDKMDRQLRVLKNFIIPGGSVISSHLHFCRALARKAERRVVMAKAKPAILSFLNRLSDFLFTLARYQNSRLGVEDKDWKRRS